MRLDLKALRFTLIRQIKKKEELRPTNDVRYILGMDL